MNLEKMYDALTNSNVSKDNKVNILESIRDYVNDEHMHYEKEFTAQNKFVRFFFMTLATPQTVERYENFIDPHLPIFMSHCALIKLSNEMDKFDELSASITNIVNINQKNTKETGTTIGFAIGYCVGQAVYLGKDAINLFQANLTLFASDKEYCKGFNYGFDAKGKVLIENEKYQKDLSERYSSWQQQGATLFVNLYKINKKNIILDKPNFAAQNEKIAWALSSLRPDNKEYKKLYTRHVETSPTDYEQNLKEEKLLSEILKQKHENSQFNSQETLKLLNEEIVAKKEELENIKLHLELMTSKVKAVEEMPKANRFAKLI